MSKKIMGITVGTPIRPSKFASELADRVEEMVKANTEQEKTVDITENGTVEIIPDVGYKLTKVTANVNVPTASGENKLAQFVEGTITEITAEDLQGSTKISDYAFYKNTTLKNITLPDTITIMGNYAFSESGITSIVLPNSLQLSNTAYVFYKCGSLERIVFPEETSNFSYIAEYFCAYTPLTEVIMHSNITTIGNYAFYYCESLEHITLPYGLTEIRRNAFRSCSNLESITLPNTLTRLYDSAFYDCQKLVNITLPASITKLDYCCLHTGSSSNKVTITLLGTTPPSLSNAFDVNTLNKIIVPKGCSEAYKTATNWANYAEFIEEATE